MAISLAMGMETINGDKMSEQIENYIEYIRIERNYSDLTEKNYLIDLEQFEEYLTSQGLNYKKISYKDISKYIAYLRESLKLKSSSISRHLSTLRSFYTFLLNREIVNNNPFKIINGPKQEKKLPNYMKYSEFEVMLNSCDDTPLGIRNQALLELLLATGARISELINVKISDIDFSNKEIKVLGKGNKERICYFNQHCHQALENYLRNSREILLKNKKSDRLFINHVGGNLTDRGVRDILDKIIHKCSLKNKVTPHTFRHTFATMLLNEGCDLKSVQELLGHVNLSTTSIYTHVTNERIKNIYLHTHPRSKK